MSDVLLQFDQVRQEHLSQRLRQGLCDGRSLELCYATAHPPNSSWLNGFGDALLEQSLKIR
jgi:ribosome modulation factor